MRVSEVVREGIIADFYNMNKDMNAAGEKGDKVNAAKAAKKALEQAATEPNPAKKLTILWVHLVRNSVRTGAGEIDRKPDLEALIEGLVSVNIKNPVVQNIINEINNLAVDDPQKTVELFQKVIDSPNSTEYQDQEDQEGQEDNFADVPEKYRSTAPSVKGKAWVSNSKYNDSLYIRRNGVGIWKRYQHEDDEIYTWIKDGVRKEKMQALSVRSKDEKYADEFRNVQMRELSTERNDLRVIITLDEPSDGSSDVEPQRSEPELSLVPDDEPTQNDTNQDDTNQDDTSQDDTNQDDTTEGEMVSLLSADGDRTFYFVKSKGNWRRWDDHEDTWQAYMPMGGNKYKEINDEIPDELIQNLEKKAENNSTNVTVTKLNGIGDTMVSIDKVEDDESN